MECEDLCIHGTPLPLAFGLLQVPMGSFSTRRFAEVLDPEST